MARILSNLLKKAGDFREGIDISLGGSRCFSKEGRCFSREKIKAKKEKREGRETAVAIERGVEYQIWKKVAQISSNLVKKAGDFREGIDISLGGSRCFSKEGCCFSGEKIKAKKEKREGRRAVLGY